jgi:hypothetical protein
MRGYGATARDTLRNDTKAGEWEDRPPLLTHKMGGANP